MRAREWKEPANRDVPIASIADGLLLIFALLSVVATVLLLERAGIEGSFTTSLMLAGYAGSAASALAVLPHRRVASSPSSNLASWWQLVSVAVVPPAAGFAAGAFSLLLAVALVSPQGALPQPASAAVLGGLYGLLLGGWTRSLLTSPGVTDAAAGLQSSLSTLVRTAKQAQRVRYDGRVLARFRPAEADMVRGVLEVRFVPHHRVPISEEEGASAQVLVQEGAVTNRAEFLLTVVAGKHLESLPRSRVVTVPVQSTSESFEFTLVQRMTEYDSREVKPSIRSNLHEFPVNVLLDVSQAGKTVALLEVSAPIGRPGPGTR